MVKKDRRKNKRSKQSSLNKQKSTTKSSYSQKQFTSERIDDNQLSQEKTQLNQFDSNLKELETQEIIILNVQTQVNQKQVKIKNNEGQLRSLNQQANNSVFLTDKILQETDKSIKREKNIVEHNQEEKIERQIIQKQMEEENDNKILIKMNENTTEQKQKPFEDSQSRKNSQVMVFSAYDPDQIPELSEQYPQVLTGLDKQNSSQNNKQFSQLGEFMQQGEVVYAEFHNNSGYYQNSVQEQISREEKLILQANELISPQKDISYLSDCTVHNFMFMPIIKNNNLTHGQTKQPKDIYPTDQFLIHLSLPIDIPSPKKEENQLLTIQPMQPYILEPSSQHNLQPSYQHNLQPTYQHNLQPFYQSQFISSQTLSPDSQSKMQRIKMFFEKNSKIVQEIQLDSQDEQMPDEFNINQHQLQKLDNNQYQSSQSSDLGREEGERQLLESCRESIIERLREEVDYDNNIQQLPNAQQSPPTSSPVLFKVRAVKQQLQMKQQPLQSYSQQYQQVQSPPISLQSLSYQSSPTLLFRKVLNPSHRSDDDMHDPTNSPVEDYTRIHEDQQWNVVNDKKHQILVESNQHLPIYFDNSSINLASSLTLQNVETTNNDIRIQSQSYETQQIQLFKNPQLTNSSHERTQQQQQSICQSSQLKQSIDFRLQLQMVYQSKHRHQFTTNNPTYAPSLYESLPIYGQQQLQQIDQLKDQKSLQYIPIPSQILTNQNLQKHTQQHLIENKTIIIQSDSNNNQQQSLTIIDATQNQVNVLTNSPPPCPQKQHVVQSIVKRWECQNNHNEFTQSSKFTSQNNPCRQDSSNQFQLINQSIEEGFFRVNSSQNISPSIKVFHNKIQQEEYWNESGRETIIDALTEQTGQLEQFKHNINIIPQQQVSQFKSQQQYDQYNQQDLIQDNLKTQIQQQQSQIEQSRHVHFGSNAPILHHYTDDQYVQSQDVVISKPSLHYRQFMADQSAHNQVQQSRITIGNHVDFSHQESNITYPHQQSHIRYTGYALGQCQSFIYDNIDGEDNLLQITSKPANLMQEVQTKQPQDQMLILNIEFHSEEVIQPQTQELIWKALDETQLPPPKSKHSVFGKKQQPIQYPSLSQYSSVQHQEYSPYFKQHLVVENNPKQPQIVQPITRDRLLPNSPLPAQGLISSLAGQVYQPSQPRVVSLDQFKKKYQVRTINLAQHRNYNKNKDGFITLKPTQSTFIYQQKDTFPIQNFTQPHTINTTQHQLSNKVNQKKQPPIIQQSRIDIMIDKTTINHQQYSNSLPQLQDSRELIHESHGTLSLSQSVQQIMGQNIGQQSQKQPASPIIIVKQSQPLSRQPIRMALCSSSILQQLRNEQSSVIIARYTPSQTPCSSTQSIAKQQHQLLSLTEDFLQKDLPQFQIDMLPIEIPLQSIIYKRNQLQNQQNKPIHQKQTLNNSNQIADLLFSTTNEKTTQKERQQIQLPVLDEDKSLINKNEQNQQQKPVQQLPLHNIISFNIPKNDSPSSLNQQRNLVFFNSYSTMNKHYNPPIPFRDIRLSPTIILPSQKSPTKPQRSSNNISMEMQSRSKEKIQPKNKINFVFNRPMQNEKTQKTNDSNNQIKFKGQQGQQSKQQSNYQVNKPQNKYSSNYQPQNTQQARLHVLKITPQTPQNIISNLSSSIQKLRSPSQYYESILQPNAQSRYVIQPSSYSKGFYRTGSRINQSRKKQFDLKEQQTFRKYSPLQNKKTPVAFKVELQNSKSKEKSFSNHQTIHHQNLDTTSRQNKQKKQKICLTLKRDYLDKTHIINQSKEKFFAQNQNGQYERRNNQTSPCRKLNGGSSKKKISFQSQNKDIKKIKQVRLNREQKRSGVTQPIRQNQYEERKFQKIEKFNPGEVKINNEKDMNNTKQQRSNSLKGFTLINKNPIKPKDNLFGLSQNLGKEQTKIKPNKVERPSKQDSRKSPSLRVIGKKSQKPINIQQQTQIYQPFWQQFKGIIKNRLIGNSSPKTNSQQRRTQYQNYEKDQLSDVENQDIIFKR